MTARPVVHWIVRAVAWANSAVLVVSLVSPQTSNALAHGRVGGAITTWWLATLWVLPAIVLIETALLLRNPRERVALAIDWISVVAWVLVVLAATGWRIRL
jgi:hypothetical protein